MMKNQRSIFFLLPALAAAVALLFTVPSCKYSEVDKSFHYGDQWAIDYPSWMRKSKYVYPGAQFQASNGYRDTYVFVRQVMTQLPQRSLVDSLSLELFNSLEDPQFISDSTIIIDGALHMTRELKGLLNDKRMYYLFSVIESDGEFFQFTAWMFNDKRDLWEEDYWDMLRSWRRL